MSTLKFLAHVSMLIKNPGGKQEASVMESEKFTQPCKSFRC